MMKARFLFIVLVGCASDTQSYCENVGDCTQAGDSDWIQTCNDDLSAQQSEATSDGCATAFDAYYACTSAHFDCEGITSTFPTCDGAKATLDACFAAAQSGTSCAALAAATASCGADGGPPPACTAASDCQAACYLANVAAPCAPRADELANVTACGASCPE
jgi:hypothetical protein